MKRLRLNQQQSWDLNPGSHTLELLASVRLVWLNLLLVNSFWLGYTVSFPKCSEIISIEILSRTLHRYNIERQAPPASLGNLPSFTLENWKYTCWPPYAPPNLQIPLKKKKITDKHLAADLAISVPTHSTCTSWTYLDQLAFISF